jgi:hypothetical protein
LFGFFNDSDILFQLTSLLPVRDLQQIGITLAISIRQISGTIMSGVRPYLLNLICEIILERNTEFVRLLNFDQEFRRSYFSVLNSVRRSISEIHNSLRYEEIFSSEGTSLGRSIEHLLDLTDTR